MTTYTINFVTQDPMQVYCEDACTGKCYIAETQYSNNSAVEIMQKGTCYNIFSISHNFASDLKQIKIVNKGQCMIAGLVKYHGEQRVAMIAIDTGAQCNVVSESKLCEIFQQKSIDYQNLQPPGINLKTADDSALKCRGQITLTVKIGRNEAELIFFVIESGSVFLLGVPAIKALNVVIDVPNNRCFILGFDEKRKFVNNVKIGTTTDENPLSTLRKKGPKYRVDMCPENCVIRLTPAKQYSVNNLNPMKIKLEIMGEIKNCFLYKKVAILDCTCLLETNILCGACSTSKYNVSSTARVFQNRLFVYVMYNPEILENLIPKVHFFTGIFNINISKLKREIKSVNFIEEVPGMVRKYRSIQGVSSRRIFYVRIKR